MGSTLRTYGTDILWLDSLSRIHNKLVCFCGGKGAGERGERGKETYHTLSSRNLLEIWLENDKHY